MIFYFWLTEESCNSGDASKCYFKKLTATTSRAHEYPIIIVILSIQSISQSKCCIHCSMMYAFWKFNCKMHTGLEKYFVKKIKWPSYINCCKHPSVTKTLLATANPNIWNSNKTFFQIIPTLLLEFHTLHHFDKLFSKTTYQNFLPVGWN